MKRLAILLAAVGLGSGCVVSSNPCDRTLTVDWAFVDVAGNANLTCTQAGIVDVDVYVDGALTVSQEPCTSYAVTIAGIPGGVHDVRVEGYNGTIINRDFAAVDTSACGDTRFAASPGEADLGVNYHFSPTDACAAPPTYMWFSITDVLANDSWGIGSADSCTTKTSKSCNSSIVYRVPYGQYRLNWIDEVSVGSSPTCTGTSLAGSTGPVTVTANTPTPSTPIYIPVTLY